MMSVCYYCGRRAHYQCVTCTREVCQQHVVPEFDDGQPEDFALCPEHAKYQHRSGETIQEWATRVYEKSPVSHQRVLSSGTKESNMANAVRPEDVPEDATLIPPSKATQTETIMSIKTEVIKQNARAFKEFAAAGQDWAINARIYADLGMPIPSMPRLPGREVLHVEYADASGNPVSNAEAAGEDMYAWVWQTSDGEWFQ